MIDDLEIEDDDPMHPGTAVIESRFQVILFFHDLGESDMAGADGTFGEAKIRAGRIGLRESLKVAPSFHLEIFDLMARRGRPDTWRQDASGAWRSVHVKGSA